MRIVGALVALALSLAASGCSGRRSLDIEKISNGLTVPHRKVGVSGQVNEPYARVDVNGQREESNAYGGFTVRVPLDIGRNNLTVTVSKPGFESAHRSISIYRVPSVTPAECIRRGGATLNRDSKRNYWIGTDPLLRVQRFESAKKALDAVDAATDVHAQRFGRYAVLGPPKNAEGRAGQEAVNTVVDCLKHG